ncbi:hypothetical protein KAR28_00740 [Candidatus Parcubacteria bacterium]|nr:hypothetical protein [Candidatus Parcubacteria bacterium]
MKKLIVMGFVVTLIILGLFGIIFQLTKNINFASMVTTIAASVSLITAAITTNTRIETKLVNLIVFLFTTMTAFTSTLITVMIKTAPTNLAIVDILIITVVIASTAVAIIAAMVETSKKTLVSKTKVSVVFAVEISVAVVATMLILKYAA